jgi:hypothetical protein
MPFVCRKGAEATQRELEAQDAVIAEQARGSSS